MRLTKTKGFTLTTHRGPRELRNQNAKKMQVANVKGEGTKHDWFWVSVIGWQIGPITFKPIIVRSSAKSTQMRIIFDTRVRTAQG